jgi:hypothetical protein
MTKPVQPVWEYISELLGAGLYWGKSQDELLQAIDRAKKGGRKDAADHLRIILKNRNAVMFEEPKKEL